MIEKSILMHTLKSGCFHALLVDIPMKRSAPEFVYNPRNQEDYEHETNMVMGVKNEVMDV